MGLELKQRALIKLNLKCFLDYSLLRESAFYNVPSGAIFYDNSDMSLLQYDADPLSPLGYKLVNSDGKVWQSAFRNFVYEEGLVLDGTNVSSPPIIPSGIYVEGAFRPTDDPVFGHSIDFIFGRVVFNNPQPTNLKVNMAFAAREVRVNFEHQFNQQYQEGYLESKYWTNPFTSNQLVYPSGFAQPFPAVFIELDNRTFDAYELGNRSAIIKEEVKLHVWALDDLQRDNIVDILSSQWRKVLPIIDFNIAPLPLSGILNTLSPEYIPYQDLLRNNTIVTTVGSGIPIRYLAYIDEVEINNNTPVEEYERSEVTYKLSIYLNAPTTPLGHVFAPISTIPGIDIV